eukprot:264915_1
MSIEYNNNKSMEMREIYSNPIAPTIPTSRKKRFSLEYIKKHRELNLNKIHNPVPRKQLPPVPKQLRTIGTVSNSFRKMGQMFTSSTNNDDIINWQNRDIYFFNQPLPPMSETNLYQIPLKPNTNKPLSKPLPNTLNTLNLAGNKSLPNLPNERNDLRFSTLSSNKSPLYKPINPKNVNRYIHKALPPNPPKRKNKQKSNYSSRVSSRKKITSLDDVLESVIYETQKFDIIYEASDSTLYNDSVDTYAFGVIMWEVCLCDRIYNQMDVKQIRDMVCQGKRMKIPKFKKCDRLNNGLSNKKYNISKSVYNAFVELINDCWAQSPIDRPKFYEIENRLELIQNLHQMKIEQNKNK